MVIVHNDYTLEVPPKFEILPIGSKLLHLEVLRRVPAFPVF